MKRAALLSVIGVLLLGAPAQAQIYRANDCLLYTSDAADE